MAVVQEPQQQLVDLFYFSSALFSSPEELLEVEVVAAAVDVGLLAELDVVPSFAFVADVASTPGVDHYVAAVDLAEDHTYSSFVAWHSRH